MPCTPYLIDEFKDVEYHYGLSDALLTTYTISGETGFSINNERFGPVGLLVKIRSRVAFIAGKHALLRRVQSLRKRSGLFIMGKPLHDDVFAPQREARSARLSKRVCKRRNLVCSVNGPGPVLEPTTGSVAHGLGTPARCQ